MTETPRFSVIEFSTPTLSFAEDLAVYREAGADGICICEAKLTDDATELARLQESGLAASGAFPAWPSVMPGRLLPGPEEPSARVAALRASMERLAAFGPACFSFATGPVGTYEPERARELLVEAIRELAPAAADLGIALAVETMAPSLAQDFGFANSLTEMVELLGDAGEPNAKVAVDVWHLAETDGVAAMVRDHARQIASVHVNDRPEPTRSWMDRVFPGDGTAGIEEILGGLDEGGYDGWYELEVVSDQAFPDSLWKLDPLEFVTTGRTRFEAAWRARRRPAPRSTT